MRRAEIIQVVDNINNSIPEDVYEGGLCITYNGVTYDAGISFDKQMLWSDDGDDREYIDDSDELEPLEPFIRRKIRELGENLIRVAEGK